MDDPQTKVLAFVEQLHCAPVAPSKVRDLKAEKTSVKVMWYHVLNNKLGREH